jgi:hypothetical protein
MPASNARLLPVVTSWNGFAGSEAEFAPIQ